MGELTLLMKGYRDQDTADEKTKFSQLNLF